MSYRHISVTPMSPAIGAMIEGVDLNDVTDTAVYDEIKEALWAHHVVFFRDQPVTPEAQIRLGSRFGEVFGHEFMQTVDGFPQVQHLVQEGYGQSGTARWHTDVTYRARPTLVTILRALELPPQGGDTVWSANAAAFDALPDPMKTMLLGLRAEHDLPFHMRRFWSDHRHSPGYATSDNEIEFRQIRDNPIAVHPCVVNHPVTGRLGLFVNSNWTKKFYRVDLDLSDALLAMLWEWIKKPEFQVRFQWQRDSLAMWDNFATQHYAVNDYEPHRRAMQRVIAGSAVPTLDIGTVPERLRPPAVPQTQSSAA